MDKVEKFKQGTEIVKEKEREIIIKKIVGGGTPRERER